MTNTMDMFKITGYSLDGGSIHVEYNRVNYSLDRRAKSPTKNCWYDNKDFLGKVLDEEFQEILHYVLQKHLITNGNK